MQKLAIYVIKETEGCATKASACVNKRQIIVILLKHIHSLLVVDPLLVAYLDNQPGSAVAHLDDKPTADR